MRYLCRMRSGGILLGLGGLLVAFYVLALGGILSGPAEAQTLPTPTQLPPTDVVPGSTGQAASSYSAPAPPPPTGREDLRSQGIDQLVEHLKTLRARKADLEKQERETMAVLKDKLKEQKEKLQRLGIQVEETLPPPEAAKLPADQSPAVPAEPVKK